MTKTPFRFAQRLQHVMFVGEPNAFLLLLHVLSFCFWKIKFKALAPFPSKKYHCKLNKFGSCIWTFHAWLTFRFRWFSLEAWLISNFVVWKAGLPSRSSTVFYLMHYHVDGIFLSLSKLCSLYLLKPCPFIMTNLLSDFFDVDGKPYNKNLGQFTWLLLRWTSFCTWFFPLCQNTHGSEKF